ncbi:D-3-phosphoglycerate dehydrogenase, chloroplastic [Hordeum vulgare]|nr:D-3-phosphoglycerate dehydrogenase, chloroplastic [Hordeum vulgare]
MQFWSVEGAEEILGKRVHVDRLDSKTLERGHTKTYACWVWTIDAANIPTKHTLGVLPRGAGRVEEMEGFLPPDKRVDPPQATTDYTVLIHVDRVEDWTPPSSRSSHYDQSGLPSSNSDDDDKPFPAVSRASWTMGIEDGQGADRHQRLACTPVADMGCRGMRRGGHGRDHDEEGGSRGGGQRSWKDVLLRRSRSPPLMVNGTALTLEHVMRRLDVIENKVATIELIENLDKKMHNQITQYGYKVGMVLKILKEKEPTDNEKLEHLIYAKASFRPKIWHAHVEKMSSTSSSSFLADK